jgi:hypothetical protein
MNPIVQPEGFTPAVGQYYFGANNQTRDASRSQGQRLAGCRQRVVRQTLIKKHTP